MNYHINQLDLTQTKITLHMALHAGLYGLRESGCSSPLLLQLLVAIRRCDTPAPALQLRMAKTAKAETERERERERESRTRVPADTSTQDT